MQRAFAIFALLLGAFSAHAAIEIGKVHGPVTVDGDLSDPGWRDAVRIDRFYEFARGDNVPPPVPTVVRMAYDDRALFIAFEAGDSHAADIRAPFVDRDKVLDDQDYVSVILDTQNDRRAAMSFRVNARGIQTDSVLNDTSSEDFSPDFVYEAAARRTDAGWTAEIRIPFSSLRYPATDPQTWGVILLRNYPRDFRYAMSNAPIPKSSNCFVCHAETLTGLSGLPDGAHTTVTPYATASRDEPGSGAGGVSGLDLKWSPGARMTLDATLNPDFSQIEADVPQLTVGTRFALDYPEKRPFFLEGVDLLSTPIRAVYTRSINSPAWGVRTTGEVGTSDYTLLLTEDRGGGTLILPSATSSDSATEHYRSRVMIGRVRHTIGESFIGLLATTRDDAGGGFNRVVGPDFVWKPNDADRVRGQLLVSDTHNPDRPDLDAQLTGRSMRGHDGRLSFFRVAKHYDLFAVYNDISPGFRADDGFIPQNGVRSSYVESGLLFYPKRSFFSFVRPYFAVDEATLYDAGTIARHGIYPGIYFEGRWGSSGWITFRGAETERVLDKLLRYSFVEWSLRANPVRWLPALQFSGQYGGKADYDNARTGRGGIASIDATFRAGDRLELQSNIRREWLNLIRGDRAFGAQIERLRVEYAFSTRSFVRAIGQYTDVTKPGQPRSGGYSSSLLYGYKWTWQTVFFAGWGDQHLLDDGTTTPLKARSVFVKVAYALGM